MCFWALRVMQSMDMFVLVLGFDKNPRFLEVGLSKTVTPQTRGSVDYPSTRGIQVDVGLPDATSENRAESPLYGELYQNTSPA